MSLSVSATGEVSPSMGDPSLSDCSVDDEEVEVKGEDDRWKANEVSGYGLS